MRSPEAFWEPCLTPPPPSPRPPPPPELKRALAEAGIASEFHGGALYCAGHVVVRRQEDGGGGEGGGGVVVEGALSGEYYRIRQVIYAQYQMC